MEFSDDERGVSQLIGAVILFGVLIILYATWQSTVVPSENRGVEYDHYEDTEEELSKLRTAFLAAAEDGAPRSPTVTLGTSYPPRVLFVNPGPASGRVYTSIPSNGTITASGFDVSNVCGFETAAETRSIHLSTNYNYLSESEAPAMTLENTVLYRQTSNERVLFESDQTLVQGSTINLYPFTANFSRSGTGAESLSFVGAEVGSRNVEGPVTLSLPTTIPASQWSSLLDDEPNFQSATQVAPERVELSLSSATWRVRCGAVGSGGAPDVDSSSGAYDVLFTDPSDRDGTVQGDCTSNRCVWDYSADADGVLNLSVDTVPTAAGATVWYAVENQSIATVTNEISTNRTGKSNVTLIPGRNGTVNVYAWSGGSGDTIEVTLQNVPFGGDGGGGPPPGQTLAYPDEFNDIDYSAASPPENDSIPPGDEAVGEISDFGNMQSANDGGANAGFVERDPTSDGNPANDDSPALNVGIATYNISQQGTQYDLELRYDLPSFSGGVEAQIVRADGTVLQEQTLSSTSGFETDTITLNTQAQNYVKNSRSLYVVYRKTGGGYTQMDVDYQRIDVTLPS